MKRLPILKEYLDNSVTDDDYELPFLDDEEELTDAEQAELDADYDLPPFIDVEDIVEDDDVPNPLANPDLQWEDDEAFAEFAESLKLDLPVIKEAKKKKKLPIRKGYKKSSCS